MQRVRARPYGLVIALAMTGGLFDLTVSICGFSDHRFNGDAADDPTFRLFCGKAQAGNPYNNGVTTREGR